MVSCLPQILKGTKCQCFLKIALDSSTKELWIFRFSKILSKTDVGQLDFVFGIWHQWLSTIFFLYPPN